MFDFIKKYIENTFNCRIYRYSIPHGADLAIDLNKSFGLTNFKTVFDVGANIGQSAEEYIRLFPNANVYSFEPTKTAYRSLSELAKQLSRLQSFPIGMGSKAEQIAININPDSKINSIFHSRHGDETELIEIETLTGFCDKNKIDAIHFLKIDTEGYELPVLQGAHSLLKDQRIKMIYVESSPSESDDYFTTYPQLVKLLSAYNYKLFGIYEQQPAWVGTRDLLYFNPLFISPDLINPDKKL